MDLKGYLRVTMPGRENDKIRRTLEKVVNELVLTCQTEWPVEKADVKRNQPLLSKKIGGLPGGWDSVMELTNVALREGFVRFNPEGANGSRER